jgi:hypothetical protein
MPYIFSPELSLSKPDMERLIEIQIEECAAVIARHGLRSNPMGNYDEALQIECEEIRRTYEGMADPIVIHVTSARLEYARTSQKALATSELNL